MIEWPASLPQSVLYSGASEQMGDVRLRTQTEAGPGKSRPRFSMSIDPFRCSMVLTLAQKETLRTFIKKDLAMGTLPFLFPRPQYPNEKIIVQFGDNMPSFTPQRPGRKGNVSTPLWKVDLVLDILP